MAEENVHKFFSDEQTRSFLGTVPKEVLTIFFWDGAGVLPSVNAVKATKGKSQYGAKALSLKMSSEGPFGQFQHFQRKFKDFEFFLHLTFEKRVSRKNGEYALDYIFWSVRIWPQFLNLLWRHAVNGRLFFDIFCRRNWCPSSSVSNHVSTIRIGIFRKMTQKKVLKCSMYGLFHDVAKIQKFVFRPLSALASKQRV